jgi:serine/threonine-protein kinase
VIQVGQVLDKYELLERVGQGGMAVVYRGIDRSLKRTVAIKILHKHLADYQEARDRFEREAQAVAKLRHENILEIYDYAARLDSEAYIVTEFIDGQTLKQFITARPIAFPEVGAMVILQVCRALAHAHAAKILHRDVKPENIMIRSDGVVKLMDFGISHMVDLERLTVTGQLLGSPAYMAPEHVEGRPIDFRTDVFAAGIVLYQLTVGRLPFEGKNPHEVLKRIAECKFVDPRQANPRIGNRLGKIILKAMAADPQQRYAGVGEMVMALEGYIEESGLATDKIAAELARYFKAPASYEQALASRLVDHLVTRGEELLDDDQRNAALDVFDRVLTIDPSNARVVKILDGIQRRRTIRNAVAVVVAAGFLGGMSILVDRQLAPDDEDASFGVTASDDHTDLDTDVPDQHYAQDDRAPLPQELGSGSAAAAIDAGAIAAVIDAPGSAATPIDAADAVATAVGVAVTPWQGATVSFGGEPAVELQTGAALQHAVAADTIVHVRAPGCVPVDEVVHPGDAVHQIQLKFLPAHVVPKCEVAGATVRIDDKVADLGEAFYYAFEPSSVDSMHVFRVEFGGSDKVDADAQKVRVKAGETVEVACVAQ